jgi:hypothetical protein
MITKNIVRTLIPGSPGVQASPYIAAVPGLLHQAYYAPTGVLTWDNGYGNITTITGAPGFVEVAPQNAPVNPLLDNDILKYLTGYAYNPPVYEGQYLYTYRSVCTALPYYPWDICATSSYGKYWYTGPSPSQDSVAAKPTIPNSITVEYNIGWNSYAVSVESLPGDGTAFFGASAGALGAYAGLVNILAPNWGDFSHAVLFSHNVATVYESGVAGVSLGPYLNTDVFAIRRINGQVEYIKNTVVVATSSVYSSGEAYLGTMLYSAGDSTL